MKGEGGNEGEGVPGLDAGCWIHLQSENQHRTLGLC